MSYLLYPRLPITVASELADERASLPIIKLQELSKDFSHDATRFAATGGNRVANKHLLCLQNAITKCAQNHDFPNLLTEKKKSSFDRKCARMLHSHLRITPSEASNNSVWHYMSCLLLPHIVRWRFWSEDKTTRERFLGTSMRRNTFARLWRRAYLLHSPSNDNPYYLLESLTEDELTQAMERPNMAGNPVLIKLIYQTSLSIAQKYPSLPRRELYRDAFKRIRRLLPIISFELLDPSLIKQVVENNFYKTVIHLDSKITPPQIVDSLPEQIHLKPPKSETPLTTYPKTQYVQAPKSKFSVATVNEKPQNDIKSSSAQPSNQIATPVQSNESEQELLPPQEYIKNLAHPSLTLRMEAINQLKLFSPDYILPFLQQSLEEAQNNLDAKGAIYVINILEGFPGNQKAKEILEFTINDTVELKGVKYFARRALKKISN